MNKIIMVSHKGCYECSTYQTMLLSLKTDYGFEFEKDNNADDYDVETTPSLIFYKDNKEVGRLIGLKPVAIIEDKINKYFGGVL